MTVPNKKFREIVFQLLYGHDMGNLHLPDLVSMIMKELSVSKKTVYEAQETVNKILAHLDNLDQKIASSLSSYDFSRVHSVERNILRLGLYEMLFDANIPPKVAIAEAIRLAKKFSTNDARSFINAVMDRQLKEINGDQLD